LSTAARIPSLDGFRAVAVLIVFMSHSELVDFLPARLGVTIFFFISGFIITSLMRSEFERSATVSFRRFYLRRLYRIFPPLYIVLAIAAVLTWVGLLKDTVTFAGAMAQVFHFTNYYALLNSRFEFFEGTALLWSLAVEEHFYLVFPLLFLSLARRINYSRLALVLACLCVIVLMWRCQLFFGLGVESRWAFLATDSRIDSILFGCIMGVWFNPVKDKTPDLSVLSKCFILLISILLLIFTVLYKDPGFQRTIMFTLQGLALFPIFHFAVMHPDWVVFRWLNWVPIAWLGLISYTFYLSHSIALHLAVHISDELWLKAALAFSLTVLFSGMLYRFIEKPLAKKRAALNRATDAEVAKSIYQAS
jgi:peptidoglycan/LPS O-acetylase OafA/YrhL